MRVSICTTSIDLHIEQGHLWVVFAQNSSSFVMGNDSDEDNVIFQGSTSHL